MNPMQQQMTQLLAELSPEIFEFKDKSHLHVGHAGAKEGGHFAILLVSNSFEGMSRIARQRKVQNLLNPLFQNKRIHALSIVAKTPAEYFH